MFTITKSFPFDASHQLVHHDGKCSKLHGHTYTLTIELTGRTLHTSGPQTRMLTDFARISKVVNSQIISRLDHSHLNDSMETDSPTAEYIAYWVFQRIQPSLPQLTAVTVHETGSSSATYRQTATHCPALAACPHAQNANRTNGHLP